jgi:hypothetical protein
MASAARMDAIAARAITVRLRPLKGAFLVDAPSPETHWDLVRPGGLLTGEDAVWRFVVTPQRVGRGAVSLQVVARLIGADGIHVETALPEQIINVRSGRNLIVGLRRAGLYLLIGAVSIAGFEVAQKLLRFDLLSGVRKLIGL